MKNNPLIVLVFIALGNLCCGVSSYNRITKTIEQSQVSPQHFKQAIAMDNSDNSVIIKVKIQDKFYNFVLESGYNYSVIDTELAATLQTKHQYKVPYIDDDNKKKSFSYVELDKVSIGNLDFSKVICGVEDLNCNSCRHCLPIHGIIGTNLMAKAIWQIDYPNQKITIVSHQDSLPPQKHKKTIAFNSDFGYGMGRPIVSLRANNNYLCDAVINTSNCNGIWLHSSLIKHTTAELKSVKGYYLRNPALENKVDTFKNFLVPALNIGGQLNVNDLLIGSYQHEQSTIGYGFLKNYVVTFDWKKQQIAFSKMKEYNHETFGYYIQWANDKVIIYNILQNSPAEKAGLRLSDHIININGQDLSNPTRSDYCNLKNPYLDSEIHLTVKRGTEILQFTIPKTDEMMLVK